MTFPNHSVKQIYTLFISLIQEICINHWAGILG